MRIFSEINVWLIMIITGYWVFLISDTSRILLAITFGLTSGFVYRFIIKKEEKTIKLNKLNIASSGKLLVTSYIILLLTFLNSPLENIYLENWFSIPATNWIQFIVVNIFCIFVPGFILMKIADRENKLPARATIVLSILFSIFFTSLFWYAIKMLAFDSGLANILFITANFILLLIYLQNATKKAKHTKTDSIRILHLDSTITLGLIILLSVILVYIQQFTHSPFIRGDNWSYLSISTYLDNGLALLQPVGKFYSVNPLATYELFNLALFRLSGFPPVNSMMITSLIIASLIPLAFYTMCLQYVKDKKLSMLSTFIYIAVSGFGWVPFIAQKIGISIQHYTPQSMLSILDGIIPKVLNDISQPQGAVPEGFKTYILGILAIIMLLYLLESKLTNKSRVLLIGTLTAFAFQVHVEEALILFFTFLPAYVIFSKKDGSKIRKDIAAMALGVLMTFIIGLSSPTHLIHPLLVNYVLIALVFGLLLGYTFVKNHVQIRLSIRKATLLKIVMVCLVFYLYILSVIVLVFYGYDSMNFGSSVVYQGFTFPWYYYPLSFGIVGILVLIGLFMDFHKNKTMQFFLIATVFVFVFGIIVSYINVNFFFTGTKEWRIIYRIIPIPASIFAGWVLYRLMRFFEHTSVHFHSPFKLGTVQKRIQPNLRFISPCLLILIIVHGVPSTILASEYWMVTDATPYGRVNLTSDELEFANFLYQNVSITSRVATLSSSSDAIIRLAGGTTAIPSIYPNLHVTRPETIALLSSDICYICIDKKTDADLINWELVNHLPLVFNNSRFLLYKLPYLEPASESNVGYIAPVQYTNRTLLSYFIVTSLNSSYQLVNDDIFNKSVLLLPSDFPRTERNFLTLDGVNDYVDLGNKYDIKDGNLSIEFWFRMSSSGNPMSLVNKRRSGAQETGYRIVVSSNNKIEAELNDGSGTVVVSGQLPDDSNWHHVVAVYNRSNSLSLYVDGLLKGTTDISRNTGNIVTDCNLTLGSQEGDVLFFNGSLSVVRIYNRALSKGEVTSNYDEFDSPVRNDLMLWLPLDDFNETFVHDIISNDTFGLLHGGIWSFEHVTVRENYHVDPSVVLDWVEDGGELVVMGGEGVIYESFGFEIGEYKNANEVHVGSDVYSLDLPSIQTLKCNDNATVVSYYALNGVNISPFIVQKKIGQGSIFYIYTDPLFDLTTTQDGELLITNSIDLIVRNSLENVDQHFNSSSINLARFPLEKRWMDIYPAYGTNDFGAAGNITLNSTLSGSYSVQQPFIADTIFINSNNTESVLQNVTINAINVLGYAELEVHSNTLTSMSQKVNSIPSYIPLQFENCTIKLTPMNSSKLGIQSDEESFSISDGVIILNSRSAQLVIRKPFFTINGNTSFTKISLPSNAAAWTNNAQLIGYLTFTIPYCDSNYFFCDQFKGTYITNTYQYSHIADMIPWGDIIPSIPHLMLVSIVMFLAIMSSKKRA